MSADLAAVDQAIAEVARHCTGLRSTLLEVDLVDQASSVHDLEDDLMGQLEQLRKDAEAQS